MEGFNENGGFTLFVLCAISLSIISVILFTLLICRKKFGYHADSGSHINTTVLDMSRHEEEKSNNLQNEENFRRYANPLKGSTSSLKGAVELSLNQVGDLTSQARAGPSGLHRSQQYLTSCDVEYELDSDLKGGKRTSQLLLQKTQNTEVTKNIVGAIESKDIDKITLSRQPGKPLQNTSSISDTNLLTVHI